MPDELGVEFRIVKSQGMGYREADGRLWFVPNGGLRTALTDPQIVKIIDDTAIPLWGWDRAMPADWLQNPRREVPSDRVAPVEVLRAFQRLQDSTVDLHASLIGYADKKQADYLAKVAAEARKLTRLLQKPDLDLACTGDQVARAELTAFEVDCERFAKRFEFWANEAADEPRYKAALLCLVEPLAVCFAVLFRKPASGGWKYRRPQTSEADNETLNEPDSAFLRFFNSYCKEIGHAVRPLSLQTAFYDHKKAAARLAEGTAAEHDSQSEALRKYRQAETARIALLAGVQV